MASKADDEVGVAKDVEPMQVESAKPAPKAEGSSMMMMIVAAAVLVVVVVVVVIVVVVVGGSDSSSSSSSGPSKFFFTASATLGGVTSAQFATTPVQNGFKQAVAAKMGVSSSYVVITGTTAARRSSNIKVDFRVFDTKAIISSKVSTLSAFLGDTTADGFLTKFNAAVAATGVTCSGVTGVTARAPPASTFKVPPLTLMPTQGNSSSSGSRRNLRRNSYPAGSALADFEPYEESLVPGGVAGAIKSPKDILCYVSLASATDKANWVENTSPGGAVLAKYDPAYCTGEARNKTSEWMLYQAWHTGSPSQPGGTGAIKVYIWVFDKKPGSEGAEHFVTAEATFAISNTKVVSIDLTFDMAMGSAAKPMEQDLGGGQGMSQYGEGCGKIVASLSKDMFTGMTSFAAMTQHVKMHADTNLNANCIGSKGSYACQLDFTAVQRDAAVLETATEEQGKAQTLRVGSGTVNDCKGYNGIQAGMCDSLEGQLMGLLAVQQAAVMAYDGSKAALQTANATSRLGINSGSSTPQNCIDRENTKTYARNLNLFNAATGERWVGADPNGATSFFVWGPNTTATDMNGDSWGTYSYPVTKNASYTAKPVMSVMCFSGGMSCWADPSAEKDLDGDSIKDGYYSTNQLPDGTIFDSSNLAQGSWYNSAGYSTEKTILKWEDTVVVPRALSNNACSSTPLSATASNPDDLHCGNSASKYTATNGNRGKPPPAWSSSADENYINGDRVA